ncbi:hypothetical protein ACFW1M_18590 [Streptomyces inhibens]|uniref:hypothetical protein n=1 Tax=Streptomyces inhibens TaxID=2293571 RepID=UPI0036BEDDD2
MNSPAWCSQAFPPEGASAAEGIRNQLGRPELDALTILVRESAQNSWDARVPGSATPVDYRLDLYAVGPAHVASWRELLLRGAPLTAHLPLRSHLQRPTLQVMAISDRGTNGLGGPTRADTAVTKCHDFVSFVRNIGEPRDSELGGGTYGFGKGIFYLLSEAGTILLHTRCRTAGGYETRLMGCALWESYVAREGGGERRYTGRHWWGDTSGEVVEPLIGEAAETTAHRLGLKPFGAEETGTTIVVIAPKLDGQEPNEAAEYLADTIAWHLWPKMLDTPTGAPAMRFSVTCNGVEHPVADPRTTRPLNLFVEAFDAMNGPDHKILQCHRPKRDLGRLGLIQRITVPVEPSRASRLLGIEGVLHHVCLMRPAELVVTYHPGPKPASEHVSYAGVFRADESMDDIYARAEPPTHDAWNPHSLDMPDNTFVRSTFQRIKEALESLVGIGGGARPGSAHVALGAASGRFASLVGGAWGIGGATDFGRPGGTGRGPMPSPDPSGSGERVSRGAGAEPPARGRGGSDAGPGAGLIPPQGGASRLGSSGQRPRVEYVGDPYWDERSGVAVLVQPFRLPSAGPQRVHARLDVALIGAGNRETDPPLGAEMPGLVGWEDAGGRLSATPTYVIEGGDGVIWQAIVRPAPDTMTEISIAVEGVSA